MSSTRQPMFASPEGLQRLEAIKAEQKLSYAEIAEAAGVRTKTVSRLFRGEGVLAANVEAIAAALGLEVEAISQPPDPETNKAYIEAKRLIREAITNHETELYLSYLNLKFFPTELCQLYDLIYLNLAHNQLTTLPEGLGKLTKLKYLNIEQNQLIALSPEIEQLIGLTELDLSQNQLTEVPKEIGKLVNLTELNLSQNQLTAVPKELGQLNKLTKLFLHRNQLTALPKELGKLDKLTRLDLSENQLTAVPKELGQLDKLTKLFLHRNYLTAVPRELGQIVNLIVVFLFQNQLISVPKELGQLVNLAVLSLSRNQLTTVPKELGQLDKLTTLSLDHNQLTVLPKELGQLDKLTRLDLSYNQLTVLPKELGQLDKLTTLSLDHNQLTALPKELGQLDKLTMLFLHGNKQLSLSNEVLGSTWEQVATKNLTPANPHDILNYYFELLDQATPLNEAKLILVGFGAVGKTSLVNRLIHQKFDRDSQKTDGIQITQWPLTFNQSEAITLHVWDFGGQEIMHSTHQFFLTERSLYLLVLNGRQGHEDEDADYWLELIQSFGGSSPVIVALNKISEQPFDVNRAALQQKYPNIRAFIPTDCQTEQGIQQLRQAIEKETDELEHLRAPFPASWLTIKNKLAAMADNYISFEQYRKICHEDGEADIDQQDSLEKRK